MYSNVLLLILTKPILRRVSPSDGNRPSTVNRTFQVHGYYNPRDSRNNSCRKLRRQKLYTTLEIAFLRIKNTVFICR